MHGNSEKGDSMAKADVFLKNLHDDECALSWDKWPPEAPGL